MIYHDVTVIYQYYLFIYFTTCSESNPVYKYNHLNQQQQIVYFFL